MTSRLPETADTIVGLDAASNYDSVTVLGRYHTDFKYSRLIE